MRKLQLSIILLLIVSLSSCKLARTLSFKNEATHFEAKSTGFEVMEIPFEIEDDWILVSIQIDHEGQRAVEKFMFDTGAFTLLFSDVAARNKWTQDTLKKGLELPVGTAMGTRQLKLVGTNNLLLQIGGFSVFKQKTMLIPRPERMSQNISGLLGAEIFKNYFTEIDFEKNVIRLYEYEKRALPAYTASLNIKPRMNNNPFINDLDINGIRVNGLVDLGYPGSILLQIPKEESYSEQLSKHYCKYLSKTPLLTDAANNKSSPYIFLSYTDHLTQKETQINDLNGNIRLITNPKKKLSGNIGCKFFRDNFNKIAFDWKANKLLLEKKAAKKKSALCKDVYFNKTNDTVKVVLIRESSKWYQNGVRPGDIVSRINGGDPAAYLKTEGNSVDSLEVIRNKE